MRELIFLPATMREESHARLDLEESRLVCAVRAFQEAARPVVSRERLRVAARELRMRIERPCLKLARNLREKCRLRSSLQNSRTLIFPDRSLGVALLFDVTLRTHRLLGY